MIGLMGGIGAGKSSVARLLQQLGAEVIEADAMAHKALQENEVQKQIVQRWGPQLLVKGEIDRRALAAIVFPKTEVAERVNLTWLEQLIHPVVMRYIREALVQIAASDKPAVVLDVPLLWESKLFQECDILLFVDAPLEVRQTRVSQNRHWSLEELNLREKFQGDIATKRSSAHYIINNTGDLDKTFQQVQTIWNSLFVSSQND